MKSLFLALGLILCSLFSGAQITAFNINTYKFDDAALSLPLMDSIGYHSCLQWRRIYTEITDYGPNGSGMYRLQHDLRQVNDVTGVDTYNKIYLPIYSHQLVVSVNARVIQNGNVLYTATQENMSTVEEENVQYKLLALEKVEPGCFVETIIIIQQQFVLHGDEYLQEKIPIREVTAAVIVPEAFTMKAKVYNSSIQPVEEVHDGRFFIYAQTSNVPAFQDEPYCYTESRVARFQYGLKEIVETGATGLKWADIGNRFFDNLFENYDKSRSSIKKILKEIGVDKKKSEDEKIFAIENYLKENVQIIGGLETDEIAGNAVKNHMSSPFGFNRLMAFCFREAGINFEMVGTCPRSSYFFDKSFDSEIFFTDVIFYFPGTDNYLSPQDAEIRYPRNNGDFYGQDALRIKMVELGGVVNSVVTVRTIPPNKLEDAIIREDYTVQFTGDNSSTTTKYSRSFSGVTDQGLKALYYYLDEEDRDEIIREFIKSGQPNSEVSDIVVSNTNLADYEEYIKPFELTATMTGTDLLEFAGDKVIFKIGNVIGEQSELYDTKPRQNGVDLEYPHEYQRTIRVVIPEGYVLRGLEDLNKRFEVKSGDQVTSYFTSTYALEGNELVVTIVESYNVISYPLELYQPFSEVINAAADFNKVSLLLERAQ